MEGVLRRSPSFPKDSKLKFKASIKNSECVDERINGGIIVYWSGVKCS